MTSNMEQKGKILMAWKAVQLEQILKGQFNCIAYELFHSFSSDHGKTCSLGKTCRFYSQL